MIIIIINVKGFLEIHFCGISILTVFENKFTFMKKSCTAYNHSDALQAKQVLRDLILTKEMAQK